ncbi:PQQ-dependent sugar dehydrogenase [Arcticibacterium luteifluviistationis]|uniref:PKD domain-containing protein n=1 Tax=Arcticibacterium luteifluviistationis TaxID=1784714 RepID=A0A2Z4G841_9BACT|nr:PQQ-dependent sugar dehydrogenase [Arcticibacterium luteifluviistationis]AWV97369.1 PKD domain-containing protein [Arcticibacterium luteifluviistationis]
MKYLFSALVFMLMLNACTSSSTNDPNEKPEDNRFTEVELARGLDEPMEMTFLPDNKILIVERKGGLKLVNETTKETASAGWVEVNTKYTNKEGNVREAEEGLMGVVLDPNFKENNWIYMYYADPETAKHVLARWEFKDDYLVDESKKVILEVPTQRQECCHTGGGMTWDAQGNLFLTVGNNTVNPRSGASNLNEAPGHENEDDQRAPGNSNDLRGKILRIHPESDGTYTIPEGNLFPVGTEKTRPEIYTMGHRNPWRPTLDSKTGYLYWGEVGPDASKDSIWGPMGYDEFNQAKKAGYFGWPYLIGNNRPYNRYNSEDGTYGEAFDPNNLVNESVNNTGIRELPEAVPAFLYYPYGPSPEFPLMGTAGRSATGGPVYRQADFKDAARPWPAYYEGKWLITEFMRGWIIAVTMDENGDYVSMEKVLPEKNFSGAMDMDFGPNGDLYVLEYGTAWFKGNDNSRLVKLEYNAGNRKPVVAASSDINSGKIPLTVNFSGEGTTDYDGDKLSYEWKISKDGVEEGTVSGETASYTFENSGDYVVELTVTDSEKATNSTSFSITAGNEAPAISLSLDKENKTFYYGERELPFEVKVTDAEDGSTENGISADEVAVTFDYVPAGYDPIEMAANHATADAMASFAVGKNLIEASDCISCHQFDTKSIGPSYKAVSERYPNNKKNRELLVDKVINGGSGVWGEHGMSAHPDLDKADASRMVDFILSMSSTGGTPSLGLSGVVKPIKPDYEFEEGSFVLRAAYKDKGGSGVKPLLKENVVVLRSPDMKPHAAEFKKSVEVLTASGNSFYAVGDKSYIGYKNIDLSGVKNIMVYIQNSERSGTKGGTVELHLDSPDGAVISTSEDIPTNTPRGARRPPAGVSMKDWRRQNSSKATLNVPANAAGFHDVYLVFRNADATSNDYLMKLDEVSFSNK